VFFAGAIIARPIIRKGYPKWWKDAKTIDSGEFTTTPEQKEENKQNDIDARCVQKYGPGLAAFGTLLWAYGDLIPRMILRLFA